MIKIENQSILLSLNITTRHVLVTQSSHEMIAIVILTGCQAVTLSSRLRGDLQNVTKSRAKKDPKLDYTKCTVLAGTFPKHKYAQVKNL